MGKLSDTTVVGTASNLTQKAPTSEQLRIAQLLEDPKTEDHSIKDKVSKVMELTRCNESTALVALHDCDNDVEQAVDKLLEGDHQGEWIVQEGKKSKKMQHQQPHYQHRSMKENHHAGDEAIGGNHHEDDENAMSAPYQSRGPSRGGGHGGDFPPRFRGRGGSGVRPGRRFDKENEPFEFGGADRGRGRGRGRGGFGGDRGGRGRGFASRGGRREGAPGNREGGYDQQMGSWDSAEVESNTWDNSMANSSGVRGDGGSRRMDEWKGADDNNTWDNSMAQTAAPVNSKKHPAQKRSNEWNNNSADDWGGEEDWSKGLVIEPSGVHKQHPSSVAAPVASSTHTVSSSTYASAANAGHVRGESIDVNMLFTNQLPETQSSNASQPMWSSKQATADLKNELGIGKVAPSALGQSAAPLRQRDPLPAKPNAAVVELPSIGSRSAVGPIDVQFGDMTLLSDSQPLFAFDAPAVFKSQTSAASSQPQEALSMRQGQIDSSAGVFQRTQKNEHMNGPDLLLGSGENGAKNVDVTSAPYSIGGGFSTATQAQEQYGSSNSAIRQMAAPTVKNANSGLSSLTNSHQRALLSGNSGGANVPGQVPVSDTGVQQLSKDVNLNQGGMLNAASAHGSTASTNYGLSSAQNASRSPASVVTTKPQVSSTLNVNAAIAPYQQAIAGLSPYLNMYDQLGLNSVGFLPPQNLFLNAAGGFDMRALTQLPPLAGNNVAGRDSSGDLKNTFMRQDTGSNLAASATGLANLSVPPPGLPAPTVSNAEQAAQILSMAGMSGMYPTFPLINTAPPFLAPQFLVPNVSATASTVTTGSQYQRTSGYPQPPMFNAAGYEDIQLTSQDYGKNNYAALSSSNQTKTVSSGASGMTMGVNDGNKGYAGGLKGYDTKSFVPATATPPSLGNMSFPAPFQTTAATGAYGYPNYMPPVNMNMMASPMAAALASNVQLSNDMLGSGAMNQRGGSQNSKATSSNVAKPTGQYPFPSWGN